MHAVPMSLKEANAYIERLHRHHAPVHRDKYRLACADDDGVHGVVQVGRPVSRHLDDGQTLEVVRLCTDGTYNACSFLYSRAARIAQELGYKRIVTYILSSEDGASLKASGWSCDGKAGGGSWDRPGRRRDQTGKYPTEIKTRWHKDL